MRRTSIGPPQQSGCLRSFLLQQLQKTMGGGSQKKIQRLRLRCSQQGFFLCHAWHQRGMFLARGKYSCEAVRSVCLPLFSHRWAYLQIIWERKMRLCLLSVERWVGRKSTHTKRGRKKGCICHHTHTHTHTHIIRSSVRNSPTNATGLT